MSGKEIENVVFDETNIVSNDSEFEYEVNMDSEVETSTEDTETPFIDDESFIDDDNISSFKLLNLKSQMKDIESVTNNLKSQASQFIKSSNEDLDAQIDAMLESLTEDEIKEMDAEELNNALTLEDGTEITFNIPFENEESAINFKKDYLIFRKKINEDTKKFDEEMARINAEIAESQEEFDEVCKTFGNINNLIKHTLKTKMEETDDEHKKELYQSLLDAFNEALTLDGLKEYLKSYKGKYVLSDFKFPKSSMAIYRKYKKVNDALKVKRDLKDFGNFEKVTLGEDYDKRPNIIMFSLMHYIASKANKGFDRAFGLFITQFTVNAKNLIYNKFDDEAEKDIFVNSLKEIIDIIG